YNPPPFDPHLTLNVRTNATLSFAYSTLVRYQVGADVRPGTFTVEPHLAERWEQPTTPRISSICARRAPHARQRASQWQRACALPIIKAPTEWESRCSSGTAGSRHTCQEGSAPH